MATQRQQLEAVLKDAEQLVERLRAILKSEPKLKTKPAEGLDTMKAKADQADRRRR